MKAAELGTSRTVAAVLGGKKINPLFQIDKALVIRVNPVLSPLQGGVWVSL